jgi:hypothetical protein
VSIHKRNPWVTGLCSRLFAVPDAALLPLQLEKDAALPRPKSTISGWMLMETFENSGNTQALDWKHIF